MKRYITLNGDFSPEQLIIHLYQKWVSENNRTPLYFVINEKDWLDLLRYSNVYHDQGAAGKLQGITVLVNDNVPIGEFEFVG